MVEATGPEDIVVADANGGWRLQDAVVAARAIDGLERVFFEQPCPTLEECLIVRQRTTLPMVLDECIRDVQSLLRAYEAKAMEAFNLKISKVGGLTQAKLMRDLAVALGLRVTIEDAWGGDLVTAAVSHLAASTPRRDALHGLVHERLDERARRGPRSRGRRAASARRRRGRASASRSTSTSSASRSSPSARSHALEPVASRRRR